MQDPTILQNQSPSKSSCTKSLTMLPATCKINSLYLGRFDNHIRVCHTYFKYHNFTKKCRTLLSFRIKVFPSAVAPSRSPRFLRRAKLIDVRLALRERDDGEPYGERFARSDSSWRFLASPKALIPWWLNLTVGKDVSHARFLEEEPVGRSMRV